MASTSAFCASSESEDPVGSNFGIRSRLLEQDWNPKFPYAIPLPRSGREGRLPSRKRWKPGWGAFLCWRTHFPPTPDPSPPLAALVGGGGKHRRLCAGRAPAASEEAARGSLFSVETGSLSFAGVGACGAASFCI